MKDENCKKQIGKTNSKIKKMVNGLLLKKFKYLFIKKFFNGQIPFYHLLIFY